MSQNNSSPSGPAAEAPGPGLVGPPAFQPEEALILLGIGSLGATVLQILGREFARLDLPPDRIFRLCLDPYEPPSTKKNGIPDVDEGPLVKSFERWAYVQEQEALRQVLSHLPPTALQGDGRQRPTLPAQGLVDLHHDDEQHFTGRLLTLVDRARAANPDRLVRCVCVWALSDAFAAGAAVPLLFRVRDHLGHRKVTLEAFLVSAMATHEDPCADPPDGVEPTLIDVTSAMLWERTILGERDIPYPAKNGVREQRNFRGPLAHRTWIFSGAGNKSATAVASAVARCIETLSSTRLGRRLEAERVRYAEDYLERRWSGAQGITHPTTLLSMNVGGLKLDTLPSIFHLRRTRQVLDSLTQVLTEDEEQILRDEAHRHLENAGTSETAIPEILGIGANPLTLEEIEAADLPVEGLHGYLARRLDEDLEALYVIGDGSRRVAELPKLLAGIQQTLRSRAQTLAHPAQGSLLRVITYYGALERQLEAQRQIALQRQQEARRILGSLADKKRLASLLERIRRDTTRQKSKHWGFIERFVSTITVSIPMQVRKILEVATGVRKIAFDLATATTLVDVYGQLMHFCERQREDLQVTLRTLNNVASMCSRVEEQLQRTSRSAYTYPRTRIETLMERLCQSLSEHTESPLSNMDHLSQSLLESRDTEEAWYERILQLARPDVARLAAVADEIVAAEPLVREALKESLAQFAPMVQLDRDRFAQLPTARLRFVLCTRWMYEVNQDLFDGYEHLETDNPYDVLVTQHEEGLPFIALRCLRRAQEAYRAEESSGGVHLAHVQAQFAAEMPHLDD